MLPRESVKQKKKKGGPEKKKDKARGHGGKKGKGAAVSVKSEEAGTTKRGMEL